MTKKFFQGLFAFFVAAVLSVSLTACPDDPVTPEPETPTPSVSNPSSAFSLVGTWKGAIPGDEQITIIFNADGSGLMVSIDEDSKKEYRDEFAYRFDDKSKMMTFFFSGEDDAEEVKVEILSSSVIVIYFDGPITFKKQ